VLSVDLVFSREFALEPGLISGKRRAAKTGEEMFYVDSARSYPSSRDLLFNREGKLIGIWSRTGAVPSNWVREAIRKLLETKRL
jgi:hypothetical protein